MSGSQATADPNMVAERMVNEQIETKLQELKVKTDMAFKQLEEILNTATENKIQAFNENMQEKLTELTEM